MTATVAEPKAPPVVPNSPKPIGFFEQPGPVNLILWAFPLVTVPVAAITIAAGGLNHVLIWAYLWLFGMTHFVLTLTIYLQSSNLRYFASSRRNILVFLVVPPAILIAFDLLHAARFGLAFPVAALGLWAVIRFFDYVHFNRQSFGVLQLMKGRTKTKPAAGLKRLENIFFFVLVANMYVAFLAGGASPLVQPWVVPPLTKVEVFDAQGNWWPIVDPAVLWWPALVLAVAAVGLLVAVLVGHRRQYAGKPGAGAAITYLLMQTAGAVMAAVYFPLYAAALALHYVEYHVLMHPRVFAVPLDESSRLDRAFGKLRAVPAVFYVVLATVALFVTGGMFVGMAAMGAESRTLTQPTLVLVLLAVFDGLFVFHYFVEMFVWKFSDPHFRKALGGLYFAK